MTSTPNKDRRPVASKGKMQCEPATEATRWQRWPAVSLAMIGLFLAFTFVPHVRANPSLTWTFVGIGAGLLAWALILWAGVKRWKQTFRIEFAPLLKSHYIQATVQCCIYAYWGWYWRDVYAQIPLILSQLVFLYAFNALLSWSRGRSWRLGCGPLPIVLSTNVFIWFKDDWYVFQFALVAVGALGKEFIKWNRDGRRTHVFNPSAFTLALFSIVLLATGATDDYTWAGRIADTLDDGPHIYLLIFLLGLVVQHFFAVTLMTLSAVAVLCALNLTYFWSTGTYFFVVSNLPAPLFLGLHLLMTDPSTSPRSNGGKLIFGGLYGLASFALFGLLGSLGTSTVYDKLLPVPFLNLGVQAMDRWAGVGILGWFRRIEATFQARWLNLIHMAVWVGLFTPMIAFGYVEGPHEGATYKFWKQALDEGRPGAAHGLLEVVKSFAREGNPDAWNELGMLYLEGKVVERDVPKAVRYFGKACQMGSIAGSANVASMFLSKEGAPVVNLVTVALDQLEHACTTGADGDSYFLVGRAYETGRGRPLDLTRARDFYRQACSRGSQLACEGLSRVPQ